MNNTIENEIVYKEEIHPVKDQQVVLIFMTVIYVVIALLSFFFTLFSGTDDINDPIVPLIFVGTYVVMILFFFTIGLVVSWKNKRRWEKHHCVLRPSGVEAYDRNTKKRQGFSWQGIEKIELSDVVYNYPKWLRWLRFKGCFLYFFNAGDTEPIAQADWGLGPKFSKKEFKENVQRFAPHITLEGLDDPEDVEKNKPDDQAIVSY